MHPASDKDLLLLFVHSDEQLLRGNLSPLADTFARTAMEAVHELLTQRGIVLHNPKTGEETDILKVSRRTYHQRQKGRT